MAALLILIVVGLVFIIWLVRKRGSKPIDRLVASCYGDREMADRLVARERERRPTLAERDLVERAIERLADDRRR
jgi:hypothetical protein